MTSGATQSVAPLLYLDVETFSSVPIKHGVYAYSESPDFEILLMAYAFDGEPVRVLEGEQGLKRIRDAILDPTIVKVAHNAQFERVALGVALNKGQPLPPGQWIDTAAIAAYYGRPRALGDLAKALGVAPKDEAGTRLINLFSKPQRGKRYTASDRPEDWQAFRDYCAQDVETLREIHRVLPPERERELFILDQAINDRGIQVDLDLARAAVVVGQRNHAQARAEVTAITGVANPGSVQQLAAWLTSRGTALPDLRADTVTDTLTRALPDDVRRVLELRQELALSAAKKFDAAIAHTSVDGRFRGGFKYCGAHTGRWSGSGIQLQNLPRATADSAALDAIRSGESVSAEALKMAIRPLLIGPFTVADFSAIEARVLAWLAHEQWVLDAFRAGRDVYAETGKRMGVTDRQRAKTAVLACGYGGSVGAMRRMGGLPDASDADLRSLVYAWRDANPAIVAFWSRLMQAWTNGGAAGPIRVQAAKGQRVVWLPSGRPIVYRGVFYDDAEQTWTYRSPRGQLVRVWHGILAENVTQGIARDVLADTMLRLAHLPIVGHVHDELLIEGDHLAETLAAMREPPPWAVSLPLDAEGSVLDRYSK